MRHDDVQEDTAADEAPQRTALCNKVSGCKLALWHDGLCDVEFDAAAGDAKKRRRLRQHEFRQHEFRQHEFRQHELDSLAAVGPAAEPSVSDEAHDKDANDDDDEDDDEEGEGKVSGFRSWPGGGGEGELVAREAQSISSDQRPRRGARDGTNGAPSSFSASGMVLRISIPPEHRPMWAARWSEREEASESDDGNVGGSMRRAGKRARR
jgi:hypothetical protein